MNRSLRNASLLALAATALLLSACGTDQSCAAEPAAWQGATCGDIAANQAFNVTVAICQKDCESAPSCAVDVQQNTIQLDPVVHTCDQNSCGVESCPLNANVTCPVPGLGAGTYAVIIGSQSAGSIVVRASSAGSCSI